MKKKICIVLAVIILLVLLIPVRYDIKDGGSIQYDAILYDATRYRAMWTDTTYLVGWEVKILGITVFDNTKEVPASELFPN